MQNIWEVNWVTLRLDEVRTFIHIGGALRTYTAWANQISIRAVDVIFWT